MQNEKPYFTKTETKKVHSEKTLPTPTARATDKPTPGDVCASLLCLFGISGIIGLIIWAITTSDGSGGGGTRGGGGGYACFPAGERVLLANSNAEVPIEQLKAGSIIHRGGRVTAVMKLALNQEHDPLYRYNDSAFATGSHLVDENGEWIPVKESSLSTLEEETPQFVYNLISSNHSMVINSTIFADWEDPEDWEEFTDNWALESQILRRLNNGVEDLAGPSSITTTEAVGEGAFDPNTPIVLQDGTVISIHQVQPGDLLRPNSKNGEINAVFAVMQLWVPDNTKLYRYGEAIVTEWTVVHDKDGMWRNVKFSPHATPMGLSSDRSTWYQLWTTTHQVPVAEGHVFADYHVIAEDDPIFDEF